MFKMFIQNYQIFLCLECRSSIYILLYNCEECDFFQSSLNILSPFFNFQRKSFKE